MKKVTYYCDKCGAELNIHDDYIKNEIGVTDEGEYDLCESCANKLQTVIDDFFAEVVVK